MPDSPTSETESDFVCDCRGWMRSACAGESFYKEHDGKRYCVFHFPGREKSLNFRESLERKLGANDFDFSGVWFPEAVDFSNRGFPGEAKFDLAVFDQGASFSNTKFAKVSFR